MLIEKSYQILLDLGVPFIERYLSIISSGFIKHRLSFNRWYQNGIYKYKLYIVTFISSSIDVYVTSCQSFVLNVTRKPKFLVTFFKVLQKPKMSSKYKYRLIFFCWDQCGYRLTISDEV